MRIATLLIALLLAPPTEAAPPVFGGYPASSQTAPAAKPKTSWSLPSLGGLFGRGKKQPAPPQRAGQPAPQQPGVSHVFNPQQKPQPSRFSVAGMKQAVMQNPVTSALTPTSRPTPQPRPTDNLALNRPAGAPSVDLLLPMAALAEKSGDVPTARAHYQRALAIDPTSVKTLRQYGRLEDRQGRLEEAEKLYRQAVMADPSSSAALNDLALCYARQNKLQESVATLGQAITLQPDKALYRNNIAKVLIELGDTRSAAEQLTAVHGPVVANYNLGQLLALSGRTAEAAAAMQQAVAMDPNFQPAVAALAKMAPAAPQPAPTAPLPPWHNPAPQLAARNALPTLPNQAPAPAASPQFGGQPALPSMPPANAAPGAGPSFPRLLPPTTNR